MDFRTIVSLDWQGERINHSHSLIFFGSCFADEIGGVFKASKFDTLVNPFGVLYNPLSIAEAINRSVSNTPFQELELIKSGNLYHSFSHHSAFSHTNKSYMLQTINSSLTNTCQHLKSANYLFITFGTAWVYELVESGKVVANCHKLAAKNFSRRRVSVEEIAECFSSTLKTLFAVNPNIKIVLTVSPIRHLKDGIHENSLSKSTLLLACEELQNRFGERVAYLPTYEIVLDELRDYRFYADDMAHPSKKAVEYIWERIENEVISPDSINIIREWGKIRQGINHRLMSADTEGYKAFLNTLLKNATTFANKYKHIDIEQEIQDIKNKINNV